VQARLAGCCTTALATALTAHTPADLDQAAWRHDRPLPTWAETGSCWIWATARPFTGSPERRSNRAQAPQPGHDVARGLTPDIGIPNAADIGTLNEGEQLGRGGAQVHQQPWDGSHRLPGQMVVRRRQL
jgi:hypothetical protein